MKKLLIAVAVALTCRVAQAAPITYIQSKSTATQSGATIFVDSGTIKSFSCSTGTITQSLRDSTLTAGTSGQVLTSRGTTLGPQWLTTTGSVGGSSGQIQYNNSGTIAGLPSNVTASSVTISTPTAILGTITNDSAAGGYVGETMSSGTLQGNAISIVSGTAQRVAGVTLTPGQWDIIALGSFVAANTTVLLDQNFSINTSSIATASGVAMFQSAAGLVSMEDDVRITASGSTLFPMVLHSVAKVAATTTYYAVMASDFNTSTASVFGSIFATRMR